MDTYSKRGGASVRGVFGSWPFGKIVVTPGVVRLSVLGRSIELTPPDIVSIDVDWGAVTFNYRTEMLGQSAYFRIFDYDPLLAALRTAGFSVPDWESMSTR